MSTTDPARIALRQMAATLAYRAAKVLRDVPPDFAHRSFGDSTRQPIRILAHMGDLMSWGVSMAGGGKEWKPAGGDDWNTEVHRFFNGLAALDAALAADGEFKGSIEKLIPGPARRCAHARRPARDAARHGGRAGAGPRAMRAP